MKDHPKSSLSREKLTWKSQQRKWSEPGEQWDDFSQKALDGYERWGGKEALAGIFARLDQRISARVKRMTPQRRRLSFRLAGIAAVFFLVSVPAYLLWQSATPDTERLYSRFHEPLPVVIPEAEVTRSNNQESALARAMEAYEQGRWAAAASLFEKSLQDRPDDYRLRLYYGDVLLRQNLTAEAIATFQTLSSAPDAAYREQARWLTALSYVRSQQLAEARSLLTLISTDPGGDKAPRASRLLQRLPKGK